MPLKHQLKRPLRLLTGWLLCLAAAGLLAGCGTTVPPSPSSSTWPDGAQSDRSVDARLSLEQANDVTLYAISLVGTPYRYGGNTPESGFDCSGLIGHVYQSRAAVNAPRTVALLRDWGQSVASEAARTGDLVVFFQKNAAIHAGIYVGQGRFVHAPSSGGTVRLDSLSSRYWSTQVKAFRRP
jgi:cell wall-associated NlpC family hydrolase